MGVLPLKPLGPSRSQVSFHAAFMEQAPHLRFGYDAGLCISLPKVDRHQCNMVHPLANATCPPGWAQPMIPYGEPIQSAQHPVCALITARSRGEDAEATSITKPQCCPPASPFPALSRPSGSSRHTAPRQSRPHSSHKQELAVEGGFGKRRQLLPPVLSYFWLRISGETCGCFLRSVVPTASLLPQPPQDFLPSCPNPIGFASITLPVPNPSAFTMLRTPSAPARPCSRFISALNHEPCALSLTSRGQGTAAVGGSRLGGAGWALAGSSAASPSAAAPPPPLSLSPQGLPSLPGTSGDSGREGSTKPEAPKGWE